MFVTRYVCLLIRCSKWVENIRRTDQFCGEKGAGVDRGITSCVVFTLSPPVVFTYLRHIFMKTEDKFLELLNGVT